MADVLTKKQRSYCMSRIRGKNTRPEMALRKYLRCAGLTFRINSRLPGRPDIVFLKERIAIFVDGCFWHKCPKCFIEPDKNKFFWKKKLNDNVQRDRKVNYILKKESWKVLRFWEHLLNKDSDLVYKRIVEAFKMKGY